MSEWRTKGLQVNNKLWLVTAHISVVEYLSWIFCLNLEFPFFFFLVEILSTNVMQYFCIVCFLFLLAIQYQNNMKYTFFTWRMNSAATQAHDSSLHGRKCWTSAHPVYRNTQHTYMKWLQAGLCGTLHIKQFGFIRGKETIKPFLKICLLFVWLSPENQGSVKAVCAVQAVCHDACSITESQ